MHVQVHDAVRRVERTVELLHGRGYCLPIKDVAALCVGGPVDVESVLAAAGASARLTVSKGRLHAVDEDPDASIARQVRHGTDSPAYWRQASAYARCLSRHCPWLRVACVAGSMASGGFADGDDIDLNLIVDDDAKYLSYVLALVLALPVSWRMRRHVKGSTTPLLPKVVCLNVIWEVAQTRPFVRTDDAMGMELLLARPLIGAQTLQGIYEANPGLTARFPQLLAAPDLEDEAPAPSMWHGVLRLFTSPRWLRRVLDGLAYWAVCALHAFVRFHRRRMPGVRHHVEEMECHKAPYGILERPGAHR